MEMRWSLKISLVVGLDAAHATTWLQSISEVLTRQWEAFSIINMQ